MRLPLRRQKAGAAPGLTGPWGLYRQAIRDYRANWMTLFGIVLVVTIPVSILSTWVVSPTEDSALSTYVTVLQLVLNNALAFAVVRLMRGDPTTVKRAYYYGSIGFVRVVLLWILLALMMLPAVLGMLILAYGVVVPGTALSAMERGLMIGLAAILSMPTVYLLARSAWGIFPIFESAVGPLEAVSASWRITKGQVTAAIGRLLALVLYVLATVALPVVGLTFAMQQPGLNALGVLLQVIVSGTILPLSYLYMYRFYRELRREP